MGFFSRLFRGTSMGAPLKYSCGRCGKKLHGGTGKTIRGGSEVIEHIRKKALYCHVCQKTYCCDCSLEAEKHRPKATGQTGYICPDCGASIA